MISTKDLQKISCFSHLNEKQLGLMVEASSECSIEAGEYLFHMGDALNHIYLVTLGEFEVVFESTKVQVEYEIHQQPSQLLVEEVILSTIKPGEILGWSGLVPPYYATSGVRAKLPGKVIKFDCKELIQHFQDDCRFGAYLVHTAAQVIGKRLYDVYKGRDI